MDGVGNVSQEESGALLATLWFGLPIIIVAVLHNYSSLLTDRNISVIIVVPLVSAACYLRANHNRYGRYLTQALDAIDRWALDPVPQQDLFDYKPVMGQWYDKDLAKRHHAKHPRLLTLEDVAALRGCGT